MFHLTCLSHLDWISSSETSARRPGTVFKRIFPCLFWRFVNAAGYFDAIADALEGAKEEIFITAWWYRLDSASIFPLVPRFDDAVSTYFTPLDVVEEFAGLTLTHSSMCTCFLKLNHIPPGDIWYESFWQSVNTSLPGRKSKIINLIKAFLKKINK